MRKRLIRIAKYMLIGVALMNLTHSYIVSIGSDCFGKFQIFVALFSLFASMFFDFFSS